MSVTVEETEAIARKGQAYLAVVGSSAHGVTLNETSDKDEIGICIEPPEYVIGLKKFEQHTYRDRAEGERSQQGDREGTIYSLKKFCGLALKGNPSILGSLYSPIYEANVVGQDLRDHAYWFASKKAGLAFLRYMTQQRERLAGERGQRNVKRPELVEAYGYDTKYAFQVLRLGFQGIEFMNDGCLTLPVRKEQRDFLIEVRKGIITLKDVLIYADDLEKRLENALERTSLPDEPDSREVNEWLVDAYLSSWPATENPFSC